MSAIRNCTLAFKCDKNWDDLSETDNDDVRFCQSCQREVYFCYDDSDIAKSIRLNRCIAFIFEQDGLLFETLGIPPEYEE